MKTAEFGCKNRFHFHRRSRCKGGKAFQERPGRCILFGFEGFGSFPGFGFGGFPDEALLLINPGL